MIQNKRRTKSVGIVCCSLLVLLLGSDDTLLVEARQRTTSLQRGQSRQQLQVPNDPQSLYKQQDEDIPDYRHERKERERNRDLFVSGRKNIPDPTNPRPPPKKGLTPAGMAGMGEMGPDGMPDLVVYHYANSPIQGDSSGSNNAPVALEASTGAFPGLAEFESNQQTFGLTRMRGNALAGDGSTRGSLSLGWGSGPRRHSSGKGKGGKSEKSDGPGNAGCYRQAQYALRKRGKSNKSEGYYGDDDDSGKYNCGEESDGDDDDGGAWQEGSDDDDDGSNGSGSSGGGGDYDGDSDGDGDGSDGSNGSGSGGDDDGSGSGTEGDDDGSGSGADGDGDGSEGDGEGSGSGNQGLCRDYDVAFAAPDPQTGEVKVIILQGAENEPTTQGVAALVEPLSPPVKLSDSTGFDVKVGFVIDTSKAKKADDKDGSGTLTEVDVAMTLDEAVSTPTALEVAGCYDAAMDSASVYYESAKVEKEEDSRMLVEYDTYLVVMKDWICENGSCARDGGANCDLECSTNLYYYGDLSDSEVRERINAALLKFMMLLDDVTHWYPEGQTPTVEIETIDTQPTGGNAIQDESSREVSEKTKAGPYIGAAAGALALLLLLILFVRRNRRNQDDEEVSHLKLEDDDGDDTFIQELASDEGTPERQYHSRGAHVIGETDSIFSDWTGYTGKRPMDSGYGNGMNNGRLGHVSTDVHQCSSATCEVCELRRQQGVNFIATGSPSHPGSLPNDATREYAADDTVSL